MIKNTKHIIVLLILFGILCSITAISAKDISNIETSTDNGDSIINTDSITNTNNIQTDEISSHKTEDKLQNKENVSSYKLSDTTIYLNSSYQGKDSDGSQTKPYTNLQSALNYKGLNTGWTINIAPGTYSGENNRGQKISYNDFTLTKWINTTGDINFNGEKHNRIINFTGNGTLIINGITFTNGYPETELNDPIDFVAQGGAIKAMYGTTNIINCNFINNTAYTFGSAIFAKTVTLKDSNFTNNKGGLSGAVDGFKTTTIENCNFINNQVLEGYGGAVSGENLTIINSTFLNNSGDYGGAIQGENCNISYCTFINNLGLANTIDMNNNLNIDHSIIISDKKNITISSPHFKGDTNYWGKNFQNKEEFEKEKIIINYIRNLSNDPNSTKQSISPKSWTNMNIEGGLRNSTNGNYKITLNTLNNGKTLNKNLPDYTVNLKSTGTITPNTITIKNGTTSFNYTGTTGDIIYAQDQCNNTITNKTVATETIIIGSNFNETYNNKKQFTINLTDTNKKPIAKQTVYFNLFNALGENKIYTTITNENGTASLPINLIKGNYDINYYFLGNNQYSSTNKHNTITINPIEAKLSPNPFNEKYQANKNFTVNLTTTNGTPIIGAEIQLTLYNIYNQTKTYWKTTNTEGQAKLPIELIPANWKIECNYPNTSYNVNPINETITVY